MAGPTTLLTLTCLERQMVVLVAAGDFKAMNKKAKRLYDCGILKWVLVFLISDCLPEMSFIK